MTRSSDSRATASVRGGTLPVALLLATLSAPLFVTPSALALDQAGKMAAVIADRSGDQKDGGGRGSAGRSGGGGGQREAGRPAGGGNGGGGQREAGRSAPAPRREAPARTTERPSTPHRSNSEAVAPRTPPRSSQADDKTPSRPSREAAPPSARPTSPPSRPTAEPPASQPTNPTRPASPARPTQPERERPSKPDATPSRPSSRPTAPDATPDVKRPTLPPLPPVRSTERGDTGSRPPRVEGKGEVNRDGRNDTGDRAGKGRTPNEVVRPSRPSAEPRPVDRTPDPSAEERRRRLNADRDNKTVGRPFSRPTIRESIGETIEKSTPESSGESDPQRRTRFRPLPTEKSDDGVKGRGRPEIVGSVGPDLGSSADELGGPSDRDRALRRRHEVESMKADTISSKIKGSNVAGVEYTSLNTAKGPFSNSSDVDVASFDGGSKKSSKKSKQASSTTIINNDNSVNYITNITYKQNSWGGYHKSHHWKHGWCAPVYGPGACWNGWDHDGFSFGLGFGSGGFSFSLFYSSGCTPLQTSWCDPWWDGWCSSVVVHCPPRYRWCKPCWSPCGAWYTNYVVYRHVPASWCTPVYAWTPTVAVPAVTTINNNYYYDSTPSVTSTVYVDPQPVTTVVTTLPATSSAEVEAWDLLSNGFPRSSADTFARLHDDNPANSRALVGYAISLAMLEDIPGSATVMRQAVATDSGLLAAIPVSQQLMERIRLLESSAEVASRQSGMARDSLLLLGAWRVMQGRYTEAHLAILNAQQSGEDSLAAARLRSWLEYRMTPRI